jgi:hypothetical protein
MIVTGTTLSLLIMSCFLLHSPASKFIQHSWPPDGEVCLSHPYFWFGVESQDDASVLATTWGSWVRNKHLAILWYCTVWICRSECFQWGSVRVTFTKGACGCSQVWWAHLGLGADENSCCWQAHFPPFLSSSPYANQLCTRKSDHHLQRKWIYGINHQALNSI